MRKCSKYRVCAGNGAVQGQSGLFILSPAPQCSSHTLSSPRGLFLSPYH